MWNRTSAAFFFFKTASHHTEGKHGTTTDTDSRRPTHGDVRECILLLQGDGAEQHVHLLPEGVGQVVVVVFLLSSS